MEIVHLIIHGRNRRKNVINEQLAKLLGNKFQVNLYVTEYRDHAKEITEKLIKESSGIFVAAGGDGTVNEVINGFMSAAEDIRNRSFLAIFPQGTGNDFARTIKITNSVKKLAEVIRRKHVLKSDVGELTYLNLQYLQEKRFFINIADIGIGGVTVELVNSRDKVLGSSLTFITSVIKAFSKYKHQHVEFTYNSGNWRGDIMSLCIANGRFFGSGLCIARNANIDDGKFSFVIIGKVTVATFLQKLPMLKFCKRLKHKEVWEFEGTNCSIETPLTNCPIDLDGDFVGFAPLQAKLLHKQINVLI